MPVSALIHCFYLIPRCAQLGLKLRNLLLECTFPPQGGLGGLSLVDHLYIEQEGTAVWRYVAGNHCRTKEEHVTYRGTVIGNVTMVTQMVPYFRSKRSPSSISV